MVGKGNRGGYKRPAAVKQQRKTRDRRRGMGKGGGGGSLVEEPFGRLTDEAPQPASPAIPQASLQPRQRIQAPPGMEVLPWPEGGKTSFGNMKWYNATKGFGFVQPETGGKDEFLHVTALERSGLSVVPAEGQRVEYVLRDDPKSGRPAIWQIRLAD